MSEFTARFDHDLYPGDLVALEFLAAAEEQEGDLTYGDATAVGSMSYATAATLSEMVAEATAFWTTGVASVTGFSASTPREYYDGFTSASEGTGTWQYYETSGSISRISGANFAKALRGWFASAGYDAKVAEIYTWLMGATSNTSYEPTASTHNYTLYAGQLGTYDPARNCLTTTIDVLSGSTTVNRNGSSLYDWRTLGLLAQVHSAQAQASFGAAKRRVSEEHRFAYHGVESNRHYRLSLLGKSGLSYQVSYTESVLSGSRRVYDVVAAAMVGLAYREAPKIYTVLDNP